jgi:rhodanese-related sulfurtransferase
MRTRVFKDAIYEQIARIGKSLGSGPRLEILDLLCQGPRTVEVLAGQMGQSVANTSRHLQVLRRARLVEAEREGVYIRYRLADSEVCAFFLTLRKLAESRLREVTVLDVRPAEEYLAGHIPGAVSIPLDQLEERLAELPSDREIVAYCRGPYCVMALDAADTLRRNGFEATRFEEGIADWRARGLHVAVGEER